MAEAGATLEDTLLLERYLSGSLADQEIDALLWRLSRSSALRGRLDALRDRISAAGQPLQPPGPPIAVATVAQLTPPTPYRGRLTGGRKAMMGTTEASSVFGPASRVELELEPDENLGEHVPVALWLADADGRLHPTDCTARLENDVWVFEERGEHLFPAPGDWTLCVLFGPEVTRHTHVENLDTLRHAVEPGGLETHAVRYEM